MVVSSSFASRVHWDLHCACLSGASFFAGREEAQECLPAARSGSDHPKVEIELKASPTDNRRHQVHVEHTTTGSNSNQKVQSVHTSAGPVPTPNYERGN